MSPTPFVSVVERFEGRLKQVRRNLEDLAHDLLAAKRAEELETHGFALGHGNQTAENESKQDGDDVPEDGYETLSTTVEAVAKTMPPPTNDDTTRVGDGGRNSGGEEKHRQSTSRGSTADAMDRPAGGEDNDSGVRATAASVAALAGGDQEAASDPRFRVIPEGKEDQRVEQIPTQAAGEAATEEGSGGPRDGGLGSSAARTNEANTNSEEQRQLGHAQPEEQSASLSNVSDVIGLDKDDVAAAVAVNRLEEWPSKLCKTLPISLVQEICDRAFPLALPAAEQEEELKGELDGEEEKVEEDEEKELERGETTSGRGVSCVAFHALAAEAVWAGLNGSDRVDKPPETVWDPRGGDRWGTAAFFAEQIGEREEEAAPGLPRHTKMLEFQVDGNVGDGDADGGGDRRRVGGGGDGGGGCSDHPLAGSSARHAAARALCMAAVSSRRGFLKQAADEAAIEVRTEGSYRPTGELSTHVTRLLYTAMYCGKLLDSLEVAKKH